MYGVGVGVVQSFTAAKYRTNIVEAAVPLSRFARLVNLASSLSLLAACALVVVLSIGSFPRTRVGLLALALAPWFYIVARDEYAGVRVHLNFAIYPLVLAAVWCLRPRIADLEWLGWLVGATALLSLAMGQFLPAKGIYQAAGGMELSVDKAIFSSGILVGPLSNGNNLSQFLTIGLASVLLIRRDRARLALVVATVFATVWAGSRSCLGAIALIAVVIFLLRGLPARLRPAVPAVVIIMLSAVLVSLPLFTKDPQEFTNRGGIWILLTQQWDTDRWFGLGTNFFTRIAATSQNLGGSVFHGHNQFMQDVVTGGLVYAFLMGALVVALVLSAARLARHGVEFPAVYLTALLGASLLEVSFVVVDRFFVLPVMLVPMAVVLFCADHESATDPGSTPLATPATPRPTRPALRDGTLPGAGRAHTEVRPGAGLGRVPRPQQGSSQLTGSVLSARPVESDGRRSRPERVGSAGDAGT